MTIFALIVPLLFVFLLLFALLRRVKIYDCFVDGAKRSLPLVKDLFPYLAVMFILTGLFEKSGLSARLTHALSPVFGFLGIPSEIAPLVLIKPFSGSGATAVLTDILTAVGADSYVGRCACVCYGTSETVFYVSAVYFAGIKEKKPVKPIVIALFVNLVTVVLGCALCRIL